MGGIASTGTGRLKQVLLGIFWGTAGLLILLLVALVVAAIVTDEPVEGQVAEAEQTTPTPRTATDQPLVEPKDEPAAVGTPSPEAGAAQEPERAEATETPTAQPEPATPEVSAEPEPVVPPIPPEWVPASYKLDGHDTVGEIQMVYIYPSNGGSLEQMVTSALQVAVEVHLEHGGSEIVVGIMEGPGENYPLETVTLYPNGCPESKECAAGLWLTDVLIPPAVIANVPMPAADKVAESEQKRAEEKRAREAAARARAADKTAQEQRDNEAYDRCFNPWNGSHRLLVELVKENINTPRSFKHVKTTAYLGGFPRPVVMQFDSQNAFGAMIRTTVRAESAVDCSVLITEVIGP